MPHVARAGDDAQIRELRARARSTSAKLSSTPSIATTSSRALAAPAACSRSSRVASS
jgi:hypothetical protein